MRPQIVSRCFAHEVLIREGCFITEVWNSPRDPTLSVARARLTPHSETRWHYLDVDERYLITQGVGTMEVQGLAPSKVENGDVVVVPAGRLQRIRNTAEGDLIFYCLCMPRFVPDVYHEPDESYNPCS